MNDLNWNYCQAHSDKILFGSLKKLVSLACSAVNEIPSGMSGNYVISHEEVPLYIGEAKDLKKRIKQQFGPSSTFYKTYNQKRSNLSIPENLAITDFAATVIHTQIGRKEVEEFGIVNLETPLNKFQLGKRDRVFLDTQIDDWEIIQENANSILIDGSNLILNMSSTGWYQADFPSCAGLYYVTHSTDGLIYIGESSNINERYRTHSTQTRFSALRRHIGTELLGFSLKTKSELGQSTNAKKDKRMYLSEYEDSQINKYLEGCYVKSLSISFGRFELEEYLIKECQPMLNRKSKA